MVKPDYRHLYPFRSNFLTVNGLAYHFLDEGRGEPILMVHGNPTWSFYFRSLVIALRDHFRVIVPDHIGCGLSDKPVAARYGFQLKDRVADLTALMAHLKPERPVTLILHDWGGMIGLAWALDHLSQVGRIILLNTSGFFPPKGKPIPKRLRLILSAPAWMQYAVLRFNLFARAAVYMAPYRPLAPEVKAGLLAPYDTPLNRLATLHFVRDIPLCRQDPSGAIVDRVDRHLDRIGKLHRGHALVRQGRAVGLHLQVEGLGVQPRQGVGIHLLLLFRRERRQTDRRIERDAGHDEGYGDEGEFPT